jgi:hypothetical protein
MTWNETSQSDRFFPSAKFTRLRRVRRRKIRNQTFFPHTFAERRGFLSHSPRETITGRRKEIDYA